MLSLWFCFLLHSILFLISQTSYRTYKIISSCELARPIMGTIFLVSDLPGQIGRSSGTRDKVNKSGTVPEIPVQLEPMLNPYSLFVISLIIFTFLI